MFSSSGIYAWWWCWCQAASTTELAERFHRCDDFNVLSVFVCVEL